MSILCMVQGHQWKTIREDWEFDETHGLLHVGSGKVGCHVLVQFDRCSRCNTPRSIQVHPRDDKSMYSQPSFADNRYMMEVADDPQVKKA